MIHNGKAQAEIIGIPTVLEPSIVWVVDVVSRESLGLFSQALGSLLLSFLEASLGSAHQLDVFLVELSFDTLGVLGDESGLDEPVELSAQNIAEKGPDDIDWANAT